MEGLPSDDTDVPILVEPLGCVSPLIATAYFDHLLGRLSQVKLLVVEESVRLFKTRKLALLIP